MPSRHPKANTVVVLDFETSGLSPNLGDRAIEVGAVLLENGSITDRYQSLINPGFRVDSFIERLTGISNTMLRSAPSATGVFKELARFIGNHNLVAHNASFDKKFMDAEMALARQSYQGTFACSMLIARRIYQNAPDHKLGTLVRYKKLPLAGEFHRALADAEMTANLWIKILDDLQADHQLDNLTFPFMKKLGRMPKASIAQFLLRQSQTEAG
ncbi:3'-5' exonuclease [Sansalvadorimonas verongulae]|uniref:3'-5' exonuclease n=1 Tax=Sansalvadorimonas verongulae TaxID=2172824 RepID=UPI0012BD3440|nr:3'-5' exonuclease [Sansalvadorimonas verongulae]MTI15184.1 3'-5' exonuclease [Sansalvadorimonas verongulae]